MNQDKYSQAFFYVLDYNAMKANSHKGCDL